MLFTIFIGYIFSGPIGFVMTWPRRRRLEKALAEGGAHAFETTLGGASITRLLLEGARAVNLAADTLSQGSKALSANTGRFQLS